LTLDDLEEALRTGTGTGTSRSASFLATAGLLVLLFHDILFHVITQQLMKKIKCQKYVESLTHEKTKDKNTAAQQIRCKQLGFR